MWACVVGLDCVGWDSQSLFVKASMLNIQKRVCFVASQGLELATCVEICRGKAVVVSLSTHASAKSCVHAAVLL